MFGISTSLSIDSIFDTPLKSCVPEYIELKMIYMYEFNRQP